MYSESVTKHEIERCVKKLPNVVGYSKTLKDKIVKGKPTKVLAIRIYVEEKLPEVQLKAEHLIPKTIKGIPTDVVVVGKLRKLSIKTQRQRPLKAGISIGHKDITAGTLGYFFARDEDTYILSNNHVLCNENRGKIGDEILQPGPYDGGNIPNDVCGALVDFVPIQFTEFTCPYREALFKIMRFFIKAENNLVDVALCSIKVSYEVGFIDVKSPVKGTNCDPPLNMKVHKTGRTTCHTSNGKIIDLDYVGLIQYSRGMVMFEDQILIEGKSFSAGGDSGSLIFDEDFNAVGLLFAGSETHTVANKISNVEELLKGKLKIAD